MQKFWYFSSAVNFKFLSLLSNVCISHLETASYDMALFSLRAATMVSEASSEL